MRIVSLILVVGLSLVKAETNAQLLKVFESDSLKIYTEKDDENMNPNVCMLKFVSEFNDSIQVYLNNKVLFSKFVKPDSSIISTDVDLTVGYINLPVRKKGEMRIVLLNEKVTIKFRIISGYRYLYVSKWGKTVTLYYKNKELYFY
jgi:hypothetical protein